MNWQAVLKQSEPVIHYRSNPLLHHLSTTACNSSSYRVSIGQEVVNITEIARRRRQPLAAQIRPMEQQRTETSRKGVNVLSLCFMSFVSVSLILIAISTIHLLLNTPQASDNDRLHSSLNLTSALLSTYAVPETVVNVMLPVYDRTLRELAAVLCILIVILNCFSLLIFSLEIYLTCNLVKRHSEKFSWWVFFAVHCGEPFAILCSCLFDTSTARFVAICSYYGSIPAFILGKRSLILLLMRCPLPLVVLVMCLFIVLNLSLLPAIVSLLVLGCSLIFILLTLITYFFTWKTNQSSFSNGKLDVINSSIYRTVDATHFCDDDLDLAKIDELSTLV